MRDGVLLFRDRTPISVAASFALGDVFEEALLDILAVTSRSSS
jgi:hypothetical protein